MQTCAPPSNRRRRGLHASACRLGFALLFGLGVGCGGDDSTPGERGVGDRSGAGAAVPAVGPWVFSGTDLEIGRSIGRAFRDEIRRRVAVALPADLADVLLTYTAATRPLLPEALLEELDGIAQGAGVDRQALLLRETVREGLRWHDAAGRPRRSAWASAPGSIPVVAWAGSSEDEPLVIVERRPVGRIATLVLARAGEVGAIAGVNADGVLLVGGEVEVTRETRTLAAPPFAWQVRSALERSRSSDEATARFAPTCGHRILAVDATNHRSARTLRLAGAAAESTADGAWVIQAGGAEGAEDPLRVAQERAFGAYPARPVPDDAAAIAREGRPSDERGLLATLRTTGIRLERSEGVPRILDAPWSSPR